MCDTAISIVYRCTLRDVCVVVKKFFGGTDDLIEYQTEVKVIRKMLRNKMNFVQAWPLKRHAIVMESMDHDLSKWKGPVEDIEPMMRTIVASLHKMVRCGLYYTDMKTQNILCRTPTDGPMEIKFGDLSACAYEGKWCSQTYPYPTPEYNFDRYDATIVRACEKVVVWGVGIVWMMLLGHTNMIVEYVSYTLQTPRSARAFQRAVQKMDLPVIVKSIIALKVDTLAAIFCDRCIKNVYDQKVHGETT